MKKKTVLKNLKSWIQAKMSGVRTGDCRQARQIVLCQGCTAVKMGPSVPGYVTTYQVVVWCQSRHVKTKLLSVQG